MTETLETLVFFVSHAFLGMCGFIIGFIVRGMKGQ